MNEESKPSSGPAKVEIDSTGRVVADGVPIGRAVQVDGKTVLQICDKDRRRSAERGSRFVQVDPASFADLSSKGASNPGPAPNCED